MSAVLAAATLAKSGEGAKAGPIGLAVILLLCIACYFLFKSMSKHMRQVRENFPTDLPPGPGVARSTAVKPDLTKADLTKADLTRAEVVAPPQDADQARTPAIESPTAKPVPPDQTTE